MEQLILKFKAYGNRTAFVEHDIINSYEALYEKVRSFADLWRGSVKGGDVVAFVTDYSFASIAAFFALASLHTVIVPVTTKVAGEIEFRINASQANWVFSADAQGNFHLRPRVESGTRHLLLDKLVASDHPGLILFSSGSTGSPKAMVHDLESLVVTFLNKREKNLVFLVFLMFDHIGGLNTLLNGLSMGSTLVFSTKRDPEDVCKLIQDHGVNVLPASPTFLNLLLMSGCQERYNLSSIRMISYGTEPMPEQLLHRIRTVFPRTRLLQTFGTSETGIAQTISKSSATTLFKIEDPNTETRTVNGELWIRSKSQVLGYLNATMESFTEDGWFRTGDLVEESDDGFFRIKGRLKEVINVGGEKVLPVEIETILLELEFISDCMVYAENNVIIGQIVVADVVLKEGTDPVQAKLAIRKHCAKKLDRFKAPSRINVVAHTTYGERFKKFRIQDPSIRSS